MCDVNNRSCKRFRVGEFRYICLLLFLATVLGAGPPLVSLQRALAAAPPFPKKGLDAPEGEFLKYWYAYGKHVMEEAPVNVKRGTDIEKAKYIFGKVGEKAADLGMQPNISLGGRIKWWVKDGPCDRGSCGDTTNILDRAFNGGGVKHSVQIETNETGIVGYIPIRNLNSNHGTIVVPDKKGNLQMFDLWEHGKEKGTFRGAATSKWNGMKAREWAKRMKKDGYEDFDVSNKRDNVVTKPGDLFDKQKNKWRKTFEHEEKVRQSSRLKQLKRSMTRLTVISPGKVEAGGTAQFRALAEFASMTEGPMPPPGGEDVTASATWSYTAGKGVSPGKVNVDCSLEGKSVTATADLLGHRGSGTVTVKKLPVTALEIRAGSGEAKPGETVSLSATATYKNANCPEVKRPDPPDIQWKASEGASASSAGLIIDPNKESGTVTVFATLGGVSSNKVVVKVMPPTLERIEVTAPGSVDVCKPVVFQALGYYSNKPNVAKPINDKVTWTFSGRYTPLTANSVSATWPGDTITGEASIVDGPTARASVAVNPLPDTQPWFPLEDISISTRVKVGETIVNRALEFSCRGSEHAPRPATNVQWVSETPELLSCTPNGACTGLKAGQATVTLVYQGRNITSRNVSVYEEAECYIDADCPDGEICLDGGCKPPFDSAHSAFTDNTGRHVEPGVEVYPGDRYGRDNLIKDLDDKQKKLKKQCTDAQCKKDHGPGWKCNKKTGKCEKEKRPPQADDGKTATSDTKVSPPPTKPPTTPEFKCKSNQDCWTHHNSNKYYCNKGTGKCIFCPKGHGKKDGTAACCYDEPISGAGGKTTSEDKFPKNYTGTILITLPGCSSRQPLTVVLEDHPVGPDNLLMYKYNLVATYGFSVKYDKEKETGSVESKNPTPHYGYHYSDGRISILTLGLKGNYTDTRLDGEGGYKKSGVYGNYTVTYRVSLNRQ